MKRISVQSKAGVPLLLRDFTVLKYDRIHRCWRCDEDQEDLFVLNFGGSLNMDVDVCEKCGLVSMETDQFQMVTLDDQTTFNVLAALGVIDVKNFGYEVTQEFPEGDE